MEMEEDKITIASIVKRKEVRIDVEEKLEPQHGCCIYRVPKVLRKMNKEAYTPKVISIGPLHHRKYELADMEKQKIRYQREFSRRIPDETWQELIQFIDLYEQSIRNCYEDTSVTFKLKKFEFITMILYDAVFIMELFLRNYFRAKDFLLDTPHLIVIFTDLQLLENQLPFFVLKELYRLALSNPKAREQGYPSFFRLSCAFFFRGKPQSEIGVGEEVKHFTDLRRHFMKTKLHQLQEPAKPRGNVTDLPCAVKLKESGVKFKLKEGECSLDVSLKKMKKLCWGGHELQIPKIEVYDETELLFRNVMALEQCHYPRDTHVCNFIELMDFLVNTEEDVDLLVEKKIISNNVGDSATVTRMFNRLCLQINLSESIYYAISEDLKKHYDNRWNHSKATLKSVYFSNLWRGTGTCVAFLLVLLTLTQTVFSILQMFL